MPPAATSGKTNMAAKHFPGMKAGSPDDFQTEPAAADWLMPYVSPAKMIWEPAAGNGNLVKRFTEKGYLVTGSDIKTGQDFMEFKLKPEQYDIIITNPPFSIKEKFLGRCYNLAKPFALLMPITSFDSVGRRALMKEHGIEVILPHRRTKFETPNHAARVAAGEKPGTGWFYSAWFTWGLNLGQQLVFLEE